MRRMTVARAGKRDARGVTLDAVQLSKTESGRHNGDGSQVVKSGLDVLATWAVAQDERDWGRAMTSCGERWPWTRSASLSI